MSRRIGIASLIWGSTILLSRVIGLVREAVLGRVIGGGAEADVYFAAFTLPDWLNYLLAGGALALVFIPIYGRYLADGDEEAGNRAFSGILGFLLVALTLGTVPVWWFMPSLVGIVAPGFDAAQSAELAHLTRIVLPAQIFHLVGGLLSATLQARDKHVLPALAPLVYTGTIVAGGLIGGSAEGFAWGVLVGSALGPFALPLLGVVQTPLRFRLASLLSDDLKQYVWRSLPIMIGFSVVVVDDWLLKREGSMLDEGAVSTLTFAKTLMKVPMGVFGLATGVAAFPTLTRLMAQDKRTEAYTTLTGALKRMLVLALGAQVALTAAGAEIAAVIYGDRLLPGQHAAIGVAMGIMSLALWAWAAQTVVARGFYAEGRTWLPTLLGSIAVVLCYPLYPWLGGLFGTAGLAAASSIAISAYVLTLTIALKRSFKGVPDGLVGFGVRMMPAVGLGLAAAFGLEQVLVLPHPLLQGGVLAVVGMGVYGLVAVALRVDEVWDVIDMVRRKLRRAG
jgi:putative peptidoglycan lipid II flippase